MATRNKTAIGNRRANVKKLRYTRVPKASPINGQLITAYLCSFCTLREVASTECEEWQQKRFVLRCLEPFKGAANAQNPHTEKHTERFFSLASLVALGDHAAMMFLEHSEAFQLVV
jgi:hypothetical protein